jgi:hypothetical protein
MIFLYLHKNVGHVDHDHVFSLLSIYNDLPNSFDAAAAALVTCLGTPERRWRVCDEMCRHFVLSRVYRLPVIRAEYKTQDTSSVALLRAGIHRSRE